MLQIIHIFLHSNK